MSWHDSQRFLRLWFSIPLMSFLQSMHGCLTLGGGAGSCLPVTYLDSVTFGLTRPSYEVSHHL